MTPRAARAKAAAPVAGFVCCRAGPRTLARRLWTIQTAPLASQVVKAVSFAASGEAVCDGCGLAPAAVAWAASCATPPAPPAATSQPVRPAKPAGLPGSRLWQAWGCGAAATTAGAASSAADAATHTAISVRRRIAPSPLAGEGNTLAAIGDEAVQPGGHAARRGRVLQARRHHVAGLAAGVHAAQAPVTVQPGQRGRADA